MENLNEVLEIGIACVVGILYIMSTLTMSLIKRYSEKDKIPSQSLESAFNQTETLFRILVIAFSLNSSSAGINAWMERNYTLGLLAALFLAFALPQLFLGHFVATGITLVNCVGGVIIIMVCFAFTFLCYRNFLSFKKNLETTEK